MMAVRTSDAIESIGGSPGAAKVWHDLTLPPGVTGLNPYDKKIVNYLAYNEGKSAGYVGLKKELKKLVGKEQLSDQAMNVILKEWDSIDSYIAATLDAAAEGSKIIDADWTAVFERIHKLNQSLAEELTQVASGGKLLDPFYTKGSKWRLFIDDQIQTAKLWEGVEDTFTSALLAKQKVPVFPPSIKPLLDLTPPSGAGGAGGYGKYPAPPGVGSKLPQLKKPDWFDEKEWGVDWESIVGVKQNEIQEAVSDLVSGVASTADDLSSEAVQAIQQVLAKPGITPAGAPLGKPSWWNSDKYGLWDDIDPLTQQELKESVVDAFDAGVIAYDEAEESISSILNLVDDVTDEVLEKLPYAPDWWDEAEFGKWSGKTAEQQHDVLSAVTDYWSDAPAGTQPGFGDVEDIVNNILIPVDPADAALVDELLGLTDDAFDEVDQGLQSVLQNVVVDGGDDAFQFLDDMIEVVDATPGTKNAPKKLKIKQRLDELADIVGEEPLAGTHNYLDEIVLPPGMKNFNEKGFVDAQWRLRKDFVKKGYLTQAEGDALADALGAIRKQMADPSLFTGEVLQEVADDLIKLNQTLASRVKANTLVNGTKPPGGSLLKKFMDSQEAFNDNFGAKVADLSANTKGTFTSPDV